MSEPFKNVFNQQLVLKLAKQIQQVHHTFDGASFVSSINSKLDHLELKQRSDLICEQLTRFLPQDFLESSAILQRLLGDTVDANALTATSDQDQQGLSGWAIMPLADYVAKHGMQHFDVSMLLLKEMTKRFSSEFAIRPFLDRHTEQAMQIMHQWAVDENEHVRRLASEGSRPRLPWGMRLHKFVQDPQPVLSLLDKLKDDPSEYVRRSVANNLNDISKDHPDLIAQLAADWLINANKQRQKLVAHACRSLIKAGHPATLKALGYRDAELGVCSLQLSASELIYGGSMQLTASITSTAKHPQSLMIDYVVHHQKANGATSPKVFKWRTAELGAGKTLTIAKKHTIKPITTRVYYPGTHKVELQINGLVVARGEFELVMPG
ncbi:DNA alkylation repair protein [Shewanella sp. C32]|uniref:DNA alkylation repair protein n=1 Tax=Shewanella electrica TaxID=515560 RepID=A0ABT2FLV8_9GAMM|nr:DNA alkylation repair protein [Shewanella electrica]MCH1925857.1 DNA alkylation repair protein [Shewanella electrica]MCS4557258.1 DNA alkylation repair protein [Shewanella electrica]